jgi:hypothetical protein
VSYELRDLEPYVAGRHVAFRSKVQHNGLLTPHSAEWVDGHYMTNFYEEGLWQRRGFYVLMENGLVLSTQWGSGCYCDNHLTGVLGEREFTETSGTAELGCWWANTEDGKLVTWPDDDSVKGYVSSSDWWAILADLCQLPTGTMEIK